MNPRPLVSVVLTTYNRYDLFAEALNSIYNQTYQNIEITIVDDCSSDERYFFTRSQYNAKNTKYIRHSTNLGLAAARNTGIENSIGSFICFLDDDDIWMPEKIDYQLREYYKKPAHIGVISCHTIVTTEHKSFIRKCSIKGYFFRCLFLDQPLGNGSTLMFTRECIAKTGNFDTAYKRGVDGEYLRRVAFNYKATFANYELVVYNFNSNVSRITSTTRQSKRKDIISIVRILRISRNIYSLSEIKTLHLYLKLIKRLIALRKIYLLFVLLGLK